jgi:hypothetical protein
MEAWTQLEENELKKILDDKKTKSIPVFVRNRNKAAHGELTLNKPIEYELVEKTAVHQLIKGQKFLVRRVKSYEQSGREFWMTLDQSVLSELVLPHV